MSETPHSAARDPRIQPVLERLLARYGRARRGKRDPLEVLIRGVLSQNTSDVNSARAYENLVARFGTWEAVAAAPRAAIEGAIRQGGLAAQKARTIKAILERLGERGAYCLEHLRHAPVEEAERELKAVKGVGIKTARLVLLFGFGRPVFVVDTHVHRVARRLGWVPEGCTTGAGRAEIQRSHRHDTARQGAVPAAGPLVRPLSCKRLVRLCGGTHLNEPG